MSTTSVAGEYHCTANGKHDMFSYPTYVDPQAQNKTCNKYSQNSQVAAMKFY